MLAKSENGRTFWDKIRKCKPTKDDCSDDIDMDVLVSHFGNKFKPTVCTDDRSTMQEAERAVDSHYQHIQWTIYHDVITEEYLYLD